MAKIEKFEQLITDYIGPDRTVIDVIYDNLIPPGENYVSEVAKIDVVVKNQSTQSEETLHLIAKQIIDRDVNEGPPLSIAKNEIMFYEEILPTLISFHRRHGLPYPEFYCKFIGGRINLTGGDVVDKDAVVILENLKVEGYENVDRLVGFDLDTAKLVLADVAMFHAVPLAMKLIEPDTYEVAIKEKYFKFHQLIGQPQSKPDRLVPQKSRPTAHLHVLLEMFRGDEKYSREAIQFEKFIQKVETIVTVNLGQIFRKEPTEPFSTLIHQDLWINNTMQVFKDGKAIKNKLVDFQICNIGSMAHDLVLFLFTSVEYYCLKENLDTLLQHYHATFASVLQKCGCYGPQFDYEHFLEEFKTGAERGIIQSLFFLPNILGKKGVAFSPTKFTNTTLDAFTQAAKDKIALLCVEATKRGWF